MPDEALAVHQSDVSGVRLLEVFGELDLAIAQILAGGCHDGWRQPKAPGDLQRQAAPGRSVQ